MSSANINIILPPISKCDLSHDLCHLTKVLADTGAPISGGLLGGEYGYGGRWDSDVFQMHPFCWCEREDCLWCAGCACPASAYQHFVDGVAVDDTEYQAFFDRVTKGGLQSPLIRHNHDEWDRLANEANSRREVRHTPSCDYCLGRGIFAHPSCVTGKGAPHFWHKGSGFRVWWYKWIGRDMHVINPTGADWPTILRECIQSIGERN